MDKAIDAIVALAKGDIFAALFVVACGVVVLLYRQNDKDKTTHAAELKGERDTREGIFRERLLEAKTMTEALQHSAQANVLLEKSADERTAAIRDLTQTVSSLIAYKQGLERRLEAIERNGDSIREIAIRLEAAR